MEMALYEPGLGYYSAGLHKLGETGDFVTAPELGSLFAGCLANQVREVAQEIGNYEILEVGAGTGAEAAELDHFTVGYRPTPADGFPVIGRPSKIGGLYIATMHSGVTLAPIVARLAADEILDDRRDALLAPFGVDRFEDGAE